MRSRTRRRWLWVALAAVGPILVVPVSAALAAGPTLVAEALHTNTDPGPLNQFPGTISVGTGEVVPPGPDACKGRTFHFHATGAAFPNGYYVLHGAPGTLLVGIGTFTADASVTYGDPAFTILPPENYEISALTETFTITIPTTAGADTWTGTKTLAPPDPTLVSYGECGTAIFGDEVGVHSANVLYTATLNGSMTECGSSSVNLDYEYTPPPDTGNGGFDEGFTSTSPCSLPADPTLVAQGGYQFSGTEPGAVSGTVATYTDPDASATASEYSASIDWGDGTPSSTGTITGRSGAFTVAGSHTYADEGTYNPVTVTITDTDNAANTATANDRADIGDATLSASGLPRLVSPPTYTGPTSTFTDANTTSTASDFTTTTVDWGDGTPPSPGTAAGSGGAFTVSGSHTYASAGSYTIRTHVVDDGGDTADAATKIVIVAPCSQSSIASNFNGTAIPGGDYVWFNSVLKVSGLGSAPVTLTFTNQHVTFMANSVAYTLNVPDAQLTFSPTATSATTTFTGMWVTLVPSSGLAGNVFLSGLAFKVPAGGFPGGIKPVSWSGTLASSAPGVSINWQWAAATYTSFDDTTYNNDQVKPVDDNKASAYQNSDHGGTPEAKKAFVTGGATGGGGSNYTGSYSGTGKSTC